MKSLIALIFIATVSLATPAAAIDEKGNWVTQGARSCGEWLKAKQEQEVARTILGFWLAGFVTGANLYRPGKENYLEGTDLQSAMLWIDPYCTENPLTDTADAAKNLIEELTGR